MAESKGRGSPDSRVKKTGCSSEIVVGKDLVLWAWLDFFSPLRGNNSKTIH